MAQLAASGSAEPQQSTSQDTEREASNTSQRIEQEIEQSRRLLPNLGLGAVGLDIQRFRSTKTRKVLLLLLLGPSNAGKTFVVWSHFCKSDNDLTNVSGIQHIRKPNATVFRS